MHVGSISEKKHWNLKISLDCPPIKKSNLFFARISLVVCKSNYKTDLSPRGGVRTTSLAVFIPSDTSHPWVFSPCLLGEEEGEGAREIVIRILAWWALCGVAYMPVYTQAWQVIHTAWSGRIRAHTQHICTQYTRTYSTHMRAQTHAHTLITYMRTEHMRAKTQHIYAHKHKVVLYTHGQYSSTDTKYNQITCT